jgi:hypothetical protein
MIRILADHHAAQQAGSWKSLGNRLVGDGSNGHLFFTPAADVLPASMLDDFQNGRHKFQLFARFAADPLSRLPAARAQSFGVDEIVFHNFAREVIGKRPTTATAATMLVNGDWGFIHCFMFRYMVEQLVGLEQWQLIWVDALGMGTVLATQQPFDVMLDLLQLPLQLANRRLLLSNDLMTERQIAWA